MQTSLPLPNVTPEDLLLGLTLLAPVLVVIATAIVVLVIDLIITDWLSRRPLMWISALGLLGALGACALLWTGGYVGKTAFGGFLALDAFALFFQALFIVAAILVILSATTFANREEVIEAEFYVMVMLSTSGLMLMASGNELMSIYLALEVTSLSLAFLAAWNKRDAIAGQGLKSTEAAIKFFLLSAMSTSVLLYGMALLYGITGATTLADISRVLTGAPSPAALLSVTMLIAGLGFKIAAAPFQLWTPDVYQGAATPATAFFSVGSKAAGFAVILRIFNGALPSISPEWAVLFGVLAFITMTVGNLIAIVQTNIKRLMAYSSITHVGYMLIGLATTKGEGSSAVMFYLLAYTFTNLAAFIIITIMADYAPDDDIAGYTGLAQRSPLLALGLTVALLSLAGIPPFVGFFAKLYLFLAAIQAGSVGLQVLVIWALIMSAVSLYYYGRVIHAMWMRESLEPAPVRAASFSQGLALAASLVGVVLFGIAGRPFLDAAVSASTIFGR
ncbi:MAG TPA: NADH-quinone oxidoreductase subunit N [Chloroflexota bacterium]|nr:NADH-quinone oxidoreductase subunit N [Chloroflexota bacterium]